MNEDLVGFFLAYYFTQTQCDIVKCVHVIPLRNNRV